MQLGKKLFQTGDKKQSGDTPLSLLLLAQFPMAGTTAGGRKAADR